MRIAGLNWRETEGEVARILREQEQESGSTVSPSRIMARRPSIFFGVRALADGVEQSGLISPAVKALLNRRVASHNQCPF